MSVKLNILGLRSAGAAIINLKCNPGAISALIKEIGERLPFIHGKICGDGVKDYINIYHRASNDLNFSLSRLSNCYERVISDGYDVYIIFPIEFDGRYYAVDTESYLEDWTEWNEGLAAHMAGLDGVELSKNPDLSLLV